MKHNLAPQAAHSHALNSSSRRLPSLPRPGSMRSPRAPTTSRTSRLCSCEMPSCNRQRSQVQVPNQLRRNSKT